MADVNVTIPLGPIDLHHGGKPVETVKIQDPGSYLGYAVINASDYKPSVHRLYSEQEKKNYGEENIWPDIAPNQSAGAGGIGDPASGSGNGGNVAPCNDGRGTNPAGKRGQRTAAGGGKYAASGKADGSAEGSAEAGDAAAGTEGSADAGIGAD